MTSDALLKETLIHHGLKDIYIVQSNYGKASKHKESLTG
jgi:hypothetical protein